MPTSWGAHVPDLPGVITVGDSRAEVERLIQEAIEFHLEGMREVLRIAEAADPPSSARQAAGLSDCRARIPLLLLPAGRGRMATRSTSRPRCATRTAAAARSGSEAGAGRKRRTFPARAAETTVQRRGPCLPGRLCGAPREASGAGIRHYLLRNFNTASVCCPCEELAWMSSVNSRPSAETERTHSPSKLTPWNSLVFQLVTRRTPSHRVFE